MMLRFMAFSAVIAGPTYQVLVDHKFDNLTRLQEQAKEFKQQLIGSDKTVVLHALEVPANSNFTQDGFPVVLQRYFIAPLAFQDSLGQKVELVLPVKSVKDEAVCVEAHSKQCVDEILENGPSAFPEVAKDMKALAARLAIQSDAFIKVRLDDPRHSSPTAREVGLDSEENGPHRTWQELASGIQRVTRHWIQNGPPPRPIPDDQHAEDGAWYASWWLRAGFLLSCIPLGGWMACYTAQYFTRPKQIAAPLLGDLRLDEGDGIEPKFDGRQVTEYSHLNA
eukprot:GEMP01038093.1.p1 GENE.GEMP01038093.1~~GEMP01038093.1.p1  ORF type:complete len:280 (+),score=59.78 GEMP01038093.1:38-877(+)